ncbi:MAG TPA: glycoside hydrolase family 30 beta sandwich domain-containing protein [Terracidiphilus sp.]|nr:glycoside hydrolase family 30 beta sandwich domain-containing protein [Terracidiphilus sp.]
MHSRRDFLKTATATAAAMAVAGRAQVWAQGTAAGPVKVWSTFRERRHAAGEALAWKPLDQKSLSQKSMDQVSATAIVLDPHTAKQEVLGFGAAMTDASCFVLSQMSDAERAPLMHDLFAPGEMAMNVCRTTIGASDYSRTLYSYDESPEPDPELKKFSIDHDKTYILPMLREARKANPELFLFSSPWSPPGWMKPDNTMLGGAMRKTSFGPYAQYFRKFLEGYKAEGVAIDAVTVQNETDAEQEGHMPACLWAQEAEMDFVKSHLGPTLRQAGIPAKIWVLDHNYSLWGRAVDELSDPGVYEYVDGVAWHGYVGEATAMTRVHDAFPQKNAYWTEGGPDISQPDYATDYTKWAETFNQVLNNWARSITSWNIALDEKGKPNIGPFSCGGVVTVDSSTHKVTHSGQYWAFAHYTRHIKRGARVFSTDGVGYDGAGGTVSHAGFRNPDGGMVVVLANRGGQKQAQLVLDSRMLEVDLPADSVTTLEWA